MAGYGAIYCIGGQGGYKGSDGINPIDLQILVGHGNRMWLEPRYFNSKMNSIGNINTIIPAGPTDPYMLIDATIAFAPKLFSRCKMLKIASRILKYHERLNFDNPIDIPNEWMLLRDEALPIFEKLNIYQAQLNLLDLSGKRYQ